MCVSVREEQQRTTFALVFAHLLIPGSHSIPSLPLPTTATRGHPRHADAWWRVEELDELKGNVLAESGSGNYVIALDDGTLTVSGELAAAVPGPTAQEVLTISAVSAARVSIKTAFNRYLSVHPDADNGSVVARQEAVGTMELFQPVAQDDVSRGVKEGGRLG